MSKLSTSYQSEAMQAARKAGVFFSSGGLDALVYAVAAPYLKDKSAPVIYDPTCGRGYLLNAFKSIPDVKLLGNDIDEVNVAFMNNGEAGFPCETHEGDGLEYRPEQPIDAVVMNPPFSLKWDRKTARPDLASNWIMPPNKAADWAFITNAFEALADDGVLVSICFPGSFYRGQKEAQVRSQLVERGYVKAVVSLPSNLFQDTSISVTLLVLTKAKNESIVLADASHLFEKAEKNNALTESGIVEICNVINGKETSLLHKVVTELDVAKNSWSLSPSQFIDYPDTKEEIDIEAVEAEIVEIQNRRAALEAKLDDLLSEIRNGFIADLDAEDTEESGDTSPSLQPLF